MLNNQEEWIRQHWEDREIPINFETDQASRSKH